MQDSDDTVIGTSTSQEATQRNEDTPRGFFADQFENPANFSAHFEGTGPEIWRQTSGNVDAFVSGAGEANYPSGSISFDTHTGSQGPEAPYLDVGSTSKA